MSASSVLASQHNFRGMPNNTHPVLQADMQVALPTKLETAEMSFKVWTNIDLTDSVGDAWFPDGHAGEPSQINLQAAYSETYHGFDITSGIVSYALQNPDDFPFAVTGERGETKELFVNVSRPVGWEIVPSLTLHYDIDEVEGWYVNAAAEREFPINEEFKADASISLGYSDEEQSDWNYGFPAAGLADLRATGRLSYLLDGHTTLNAAVNATTIIDDELQDWFDQIDIASDNVWVEFGVVWGY